MIKKILVALFCLPFFVNAQSNYNLSLVGSYNWDGVSYDSEGSDIWGWIDPSTGVEYALVGLNLGFSVIDLSTPQSPTEIFFIPDVDDTWRDIKTWSHYAYIITEGGGGALGDPLIIVKKYFGDEVAKRIPLDTRTEVIDTFVENVRFTKDRAGFPNDDPRFIPDDLPEFKHGGLAQILEV